MVDENNNVSVGEINLATEQTQSESVNDWRSDVPQEFHKLIENYSSPAEAINGLAKSYANAQQLIGRKVDEFANDHWDIWHEMTNERNGVPQDPADYNIDVSSVPDDVFFSADEEKAIRQDFHDLGLNNEQAQKFFDRSVELSQHIVAETQARADEDYSHCMNTLASLWGDQYEAKINALGLAIDKFAPEALGISADALREEWQMLGIDKYAPYTQTIFALLGELFMDKGQAGYGNLAPIDAAAKLEQLKADPRTFQAMSDPRDPLHEQITKEFRALQAMRG